MSELLKLAAVIEIDRLREQNRKLRQQVKRLKAKKPAETTKQ